VSDPQATSQSTAHAHTSSAVPDGVRWSADFDELEVGQRFRSVQRTVREADVIGFCALTCDWHPQHCDARWAAASPFGERIAHGMLVLSFAVGLVPLDPDRVLALRRVADVVFKRPVRLGERIAVDGELTALKPVDEQAGLVELRWAIRNQDEELVCRASVQVLWRRGAAPARARDVRFWNETGSEPATPGDFVPVPL
jgi:3-hydroxybutyryl-CoA dehydratase